MYAVVKCVVGFPQQALMPIMVYFAYYSVIILLRHNERNGPSFPNIYPEKVCAQQEGFNEAII